MLALILAVAVLSDFSTVKLFFFHFPYSTFWKKVLVCTLGHGNLYSPRRTEHLHVLSGILWHRRCIFFLIYLLVQSLIYIGMDHRCLFYTLGCIPILLYLFCFSQIVPALVTISSLSRLLWSLLATNPSVHPSLFSCKSYLIFTKFLTINQ